MFRCYRRESAASPWKCWYENIIVTEYPVTNQGEGSTPVRWKEQRHTRVRAFTNSVVVFICLKALWSLFYNRMISIYINIIIIK